MKFEINNKKKSNITNNLIKNYYVISMINISNKGNLFITWKGKKFNIKNKKINGVKNGDIVKIKFKRKKGVINGKILKVITKKNQKLIGVLKINNKKSFKYNNLKFTGVVIVYKSNINIDICISKYELKKYNNNDKVLVKIISWKKSFKNPLGKILKVFGKIGEYNTELYSIIEEYNILYKFSKQSKKESKYIFEKYNHITNYGNRKDIRNINTFTIDPKDAKDYDDALSIQKIDQTTWQIGVHISDVTYFIKEGSFLDKEAYLRSTSIYLIGKNIPMIPKILSNNLCSLEPKKDRFSFSCIFKINKSGKILEYWIGKTIINSNKRFTYDDVQKIIIQKKGKFYEEINTLLIFSKILRKHRLQNGSILLNKTEPKFKLDNNKNPISIYLEKSNDSQNLIEEFMLLTNRTISEYVNSIIKNKNNPYIYRIHDKPDYEKILLLKNIIKPLGYIFNLNNVKQSINKLLIQIKGKPEQNMIENLILRSMSKAKYSTKNIGHYGLSFINYTHFTSPIRRYSDIIAHRLLNKYLTGKFIENIKKIEYIELYEKQSEYCSYKEKVAIDIERDFIKFMQIKFLQKFIGKNFDGVITGLTEWNVYIDIILFQTEGMIKIKDIKEDDYKFEPKKYRIIGVFKKKIYYLGDIIKIKLVDINIAKKNIIIKWL